DNRCRVWIVSLCEIARLGAETNPRSVGEAGNGIVFILRATVLESLLAGGPATGRWLGAPSADRRRIRYVRTRRLPSRGTDSPVRTVDQGQTVPIAHDLVMGIAVGTTQPLAVFPRLSNSPRRASYPVLPMSFFAVARVRSATWRCHKPPPRQIR